MSASRRDIAEARRRMVESPSDAAEIAIALILSEIVDGEPDALTEMQAVALGWWWVTQDEAHA